MLEAWRRGFALVTAAVKSAREDAGESLASRAEWLHTACERATSSLGLELDFAGETPASGLIVSNHLSYLDIVVLATRMPCVFVAKREVAGWPVFGWFARRSGTIFVDRENRRDVARANHEIAAALAAGVRVVIFPEGTTSGGDKVLPFRASLLEPALRLSSPLTTAGITYQVEPGTVARDVSYWGDMTLLPHLLNLLRRRKVGARISIGHGRPARGDRKSLARALRLEIDQLRQSDEPDLNAPRSRAA